ncbi:MAG: UDP-2,4-diacetamido-2,4,6-trideoxy-beta-L-altropyranose hydrolase [Lachnospiraceae bacterium]|nr:UDP-2,4-diacetamido-2,4,6-trideoxy-beta-L-altropyranose hydrolase [Lachnospiraceae bacterium]
MKIVFRADANSNIGQGHVMRCLSLCDALSEKGNTCIIVSAEENVLSRTKERGYKAYLLNTKYNELDSEIPKLTEILDQEEADFLIVDSYYVTKRYFDTLKNRIRIVYFDDLCECAYNVDCIINYNVNSDEKKYRELYEKENRNLPMLILGTMYAPLRKEFSENKDGRINKTDCIEEGKIKKIMVSVGGADPLHLAIGFAKMFSENEFFKNIKVRMVLGRFEPDIEEIVNISGSHDNIEVLVDIKNMKEVIEGSDLVISAAGSTQYEICACGKPCICFSMADNQVEGGMRFGETKAFEYAGDVRENPGFFEDVLSIIRELSMDPERLKEMSKRASEITDGCGAYRMADVLESAYSK